MKVEGIAAIVTGGASGLGNATARALAAAGAKVALLDLNESAAPGRRPRSAGSRSAATSSDAASAEAAVARAAEAHGPARILVNCAGIAPAARIVGRNGPADSRPMRKVIHVNLIGTFNMMRLVAAGAMALEPLEGGERGVIVSTASVAAYEGQIGQAAYASSKAGVVGLTLPAAREFASVGIRVCAIAPGIFETPMLRGLPQEVQDSLGALRAVPVPPRQAGGIRHARHGDHRQPDAERRDDPPRRRAPHAAALDGVRRHGRPRGGPAPNGPTPPRKSGPIVGWRVPIRHAPEHGIGVASGAVGPQRRLVVDPGEDQDPGPAVVAEEEAEAAVAEPGPEPVPTVGAERVALPILRARRIARDRLEEEPGRCRAESSFALALVRYPDASVSRAEATAVVRRSSWSSRSGWA